MAQIFISYAHEDFDEVKKLYERLKESGFNPWMDKVDLVGGQRWRRAIEKALKRSALFILCVSRSVNRQGFVQREIKIALDLWQEKLEDDIYLIPALLEPVDHLELPDGISDFHWVALYEQDGWRQLTRALELGLLHAGSVRSRGEFLERRRLSLAWRFNAGIPVSVAFPSRSDG